VPKEYLARMGKKQRGKPLEVAEVLSMLSDALRKAEEILHRASDDEFALKACHCLSQTAGQYVRVLSEGELEQRIKALEEVVRGRVA
jgi:hypothetical protein